ncbi:ATP-dependent DNA helicase RecG [Patescibacteria group bacterium]|nr:ATP-dependent DNA helicase RecG [Patescibacteria group bacterium]
MTLDDTIEKHFNRLGHTHKQALKKLNLVTIGDLLFHYPSRYESISDTKPIADLKKGDTAVLYGKIHSLKTKKAFRKKTPIAEGFIEDSTGKIKVIWFHQPYIAKMIENGSHVKLAGKVTGSETSLYLANPEIAVVSEIPLDTGDSLFKNNGDKQNKQMFYPVYPESRGITSRWFYHAIVKMFTNGILDSIEDFVPPAILKKYNLPTLKTALVWIHTPKKTADCMSARKRFAFEEVFFIQLAKQKERHEYEKKSSFKINVDRKKLENFTDRFPFKMTNAQQRAVDEILNDFKTPLPMSRLLEGDVGSGKTAVAASTVYSVTTTNPMGQDFGNLQTAYMVPTEILAKQHFESFISYFSHMPINIGLITSSGCKKFPSKVDPGGATDISRSQLLKWVENGEIPILIGTHALIQKSVKFENLAYVIIDEQHRFGTAQRQKLARKDNISPHLLSMTATPIPRTLALTIYGDLDLTLLDEMPPGRKPVITETVLQAGREKIYEKIRNELKSGRQMYVICPRIDEPDPKKELALNVKSVKEEAKRLKKDVFQEYEIEILHSKIKPKEKDEIMERFLKKEINILVATSVVEVGVNVPNATVIIIEGAERFGLAQLHQLRGRVLRSTHQSYCFVFADTKGSKTIERLKALQGAKNGFELAEFDLSNRGSGELYGRKQSGLSDIAMEAMKNIKMVEAARSEAQKLVAEDPDFKKHPQLQQEIKKREHSLHLE